MTETKASLGNRDPTRIRIFVTVGTTRFDALIRAVLSSDFLSALSTIKLPGGHSASECKLTIQYGNSAIADILTTSSLASIDNGSEIVPEPGLRIIDGRRVYQNKADLPALDPGKTGTLTGLRLRPKKMKFEENTSGDEQSAGTSVFDRILEEAKAFRGSSNSASTAASSALRDTILEATTQEGIDIEMFQFAPDLKEYIEASDVVVSHAGSGTILEALRVKPTAPALVAVPNTSLMDNHQAELADALASDAYLIAGKEATLAQDVKHALWDKASGKTKRFPDFDPSRFTAIVDDLLGF